MSSKAERFLNKTLGADFFESLQKTELWKPGTKTVTDIDDMRIGLKIVPRALMSLLIRELAPMKIGDHKDIVLPIGEMGIPDEDAVIKVDKLEKDTYSGQIEQGPKVIVDFKYRSIPGLGLVVMSAFELYPIEELEKPSQTDVSLDLKIQKLIDDRLHLHDLIGKVIDKKLMEKDAVEKLILAKLSEAVDFDKKKEEIEPLRQLSDPQEDKELKFESPKKKALKLKEFLDSRKNKLKKKEFSVHLAKGEMVDCPDCGKNIFSGTNFSGCICLGEDMNKKVFIKKNEDGIKIRFGRGWDQENIEMLLEVLRSKHGR